MRASVVVEQLWPVLPERPNMTDQRLLYVIAYSDKGPCKIGYAARPERRLVCLQSGTPAELRLFSRWRCAHMTAPQLERHVHAFMKPIQVRGEWYATTPAEIAAILTGLPGVTEHTVESQQAEALMQAAALHPRATN